LTASVPLSEREIAHFAPKRQLEKELLPSPVAAEPSFA
jgi:hypothetical protein